jgi:site-specific DNA-methyltransferase (adenine-specific)
MTFALSPNPETLPPDWRAFALGAQNIVRGGSLLVHADSIAWLGAIAGESLHAIVTDPPYGIKEYDFDQLEKRELGHGGVWRIPPSFDGHLRAPLPRFTALNDKERQFLRHFFVEWARLALHALRPGGHVLIASNTFLAQMVFEALSAGGLEYRGMLMRTVRTLRGGDRPKNHEQEFPDVCSLPRGCYEPWGIFRKPLPVGMTLAECLRAYQTGGLRRRPDGNPLEDLIESTRTPQAERRIAPHPSLKPQAFMRQLVYAALPLGQGIIADPFMGSGSTLAAAEAVGLRAVGVERHPTYFDMACQAVLPLSQVQAGDEPVMRRLL